MAKTNKPAENTATKAVFMPEHLRVVKKIEKSMRFWNFKKNDTLYCAFLRHEKLEHKVFVVRELTTNEEYYLPAHEQIGKAFEEGENLMYYKIKFLEEVPFNKGTKTFNIYEIDLLEIPA